MQQKQPVTQQSIPPSNTSTKVAPVVRHQSAIEKLWQQTRGTLKGRFILLAACIVIFALAQALFFAHSFQQASSDLDTINSGSIPSIDAAQAMAQYIEDIDAKSADYLATAPLTTTVPCSIVGTTFNPGPLTVHDCDDRNISAEIVLANQQLYLAIHNVTYPGERTATERITAGFEDYMAQVAIMRHEYDLAISKTNTRDVHMQKAHEAYIAANAILTTAIVTKPTSQTAQNYVYDEKICLPVLSMVNVWPRPYGRLAVCAITLTALALSIINTSLLPMTIRRISWDIPSCYPSFYVSFHACSSLARLDIWLPKRIVLSILDSLWLYSSASSSALRRSRFLLNPLVGTAILGIW